MKRLTFLLCLLLLPLFITQAQSYNYIDVDKGLSHNHVYSIKKDINGYMWFLTYAGADRFNGSEFKHYRFFDQGRELNSSIHLGELFQTPDSLLWQVGPNGKVFQYNINFDRFDLVYRYPTAIEETAALDYYLVDNSKRIWMSFKGNLHVFNYDKKQEVTINQHPLYAITTVAQIYPDRYAIGTTQGIYIADIINDTLCLNNESSIYEKLPFRIDKLHYHKESHSLVISTLRDGIFIYNSETKDITENNINISGISISKIESYSTNEVLLATDGAGVLKLDLIENKITPFIQADFDIPNGMNSNNIVDLHLDNDNRIWITGYLTGIIVRDDNIPSFHWIKHTINNNQSLVHDEVNSILEDSDGDIWYATTNGISHYNMNTHRWNSYLSTHDKSFTLNNHMFISLCEIEPGIIWAGGYNSGIYQINKHTGEAKLLLSNLLEEINQPDKYIRSILKDDNNSIWIGDYYSLKQIEPKTKRVRYFNDINYVTSLIEKDENSIWVGTARGLYLLEKKTGNHRRLELPIQTSFVYTLAQNKEGLLFIGTNNEGLLIFDPITGEFTHLHTENSQLITNNIRSIIADSNNEHVLMATESGLTKLNLENKTIHNWTADQGLLTTFFNTNASIQIRNGDYLFGSTNGVVWIDNKVELAFDYNSKMVFEELNINQEIIYPNDGTDIIEQLIDKTDQITLSSKQNNLALKIGSINYTYPSNILYSWKMAGLTENWSRPTKENLLYFTHLPPGSYTLRIRTVSREDKNQIFEERALNIEVLNPYWWGIIARIVYLLLGITTVVLIIQYFVHKSKKKLVDHTKQFYYNTAHDIKVPLRLIKQPLQEIREKEQLSQAGLDNIRIILRNLNTLLSQNENVINYDRIENNKKELYLSEQELSKLITGLIEDVKPSAEIKQISIDFTNTIEKQVVWLDKDKITTVLNRAINNAIEYSPDFKTIQIKLGLENNQWFIEIKHKGKSISDEIVETIKTHRTMDDAIYHSSESQREIGIRLIYKLVNIHKGKVELINKEQEGTYFKVSFPLDIKSPKDKTTTQTPVVSQQDELPNINHRILNEHNILSNGDKPTLLLVEDEKELQDEISSNLNKEFDITIAETAEKAIQISKELRPDIIITKMYLKDMRGAELSLTLKSNIETSHIPIILMTESNDEKHIIKGLQNGADEYILKPFNYRILKASISNLLANRAILRGRYASLELQEPIDCVNCATDLDWKFIATIKEKVEENMSDPSFNVDSLCAIMNMSRTSFYNKLKALTDQTPSDFIRLIKLNHAALLLKRREHTIAEIAEITGFNDAKYFREVFKKHYHMTPSKYAKEKS